MSWCLSAPSAKQGAARHSLVRASLRCLEHVHSSSLIVETPHYSSFTELEHVFRAQQSRLRATFARL
jgi:hypothetical protein